MKSEYQLLIIGAGAAGIGAARAAAAANTDYLVLEAAHRVGGRGHTEELAPGVPWDVGCHWLHSGSINSLASIADELGISYDNSENSREFYLDNGWISKAQKADYRSFSDAYWNEMQAAHLQGSDKSILEFIDLDNQWASYASYWQSLMTSEDVDKVSAMDLTSYNDTGENWPVYSGYGALLEAAATDINVKFNSAVNAIDYSGNKVKVKTARGELCANHVIVAVSNGVLGARDIQFSPELPVEKQECIAALPLGCYNNLALMYDNDPFGPEAPQRIDYSGRDDKNLALKLRPCGLPYVYVAVAGGTARWLEKQPSEASREYLLDALCDIFGTGIRNSFGRFRHSAWGTDPFIKGSYSACKPGYASCRKHMGDPVADKLYFAGEATSKDAFCTAHGAFDSGIRAFKETCA